MTDMNMRERLARAVELKLLEFEQWELTPSEALEIADAVLDELMTPTDGMMEAALASRKHYLTDRHMEVLRSDLNDKFTAMIKAAKEGK